MFLERQNDLLFSSLHHQIRIGPSPIKKMIWVFFSFLDVIPKMKPWNELDRSPLMVGVFPLDGTGNPRENTTKTKGPLKWEV